MEWVKIIYAVKNVGGFYWMEDAFLPGKLSKIAEKVLGVKDKMLALNKRAWKGNMGFCSNLTGGNIKQRRLKLAMLAHLSRLDLLKNQSSA